ncbi:hypothetical protein FQN54_005024 [Arachnomyces sp. PD_36]|nr:hypothetical protein FQN54_005024 [Arachnomyces sp. PD_36]
MGITNAVLLAGLALTASVTASPSGLLDSRTVGDACTGTHGDGTCQSTSACKGISYSEPFCPNDPDGIQCCVELPCTATDGGEGLCASVSRGGCAGGNMFPPAEGSTCGDDADLQCCILPPPPEGDAIGQAILDKAREAAGTPYAWGGGSCDGPTGDIAPYDYGEIGYDCSGLVNWALCQVSGIDNFGTSMRVTTGLYCDTEAELGFPKLPYAERRPGDAVFFGTPCDCAGGIYHVGLVTEDLDVMWNAPDDETNEPVDSTISNPCEYVVRLHV